MLQLKEQCEPQNYDECSFSQSNAEVQACRYLQPSILNKSCIHSVSFVDCRLKQFPDLPVNTQKLDLSRNSISSFPLTLSCLKQIKISNNLIERIPEEINDIVTLRIIRANSNNISLIPFLQHVRHLQLNRNPIKMITTKISETRLQFIAFDWLPYLMQSAFKTAEQNPVYALCDMIEQAKLDSMTYFVSFQTLFEQRKSNINDISFLTHKAIGEKSDWFIDFLRDHDSQINFNAMLYMNRPLLEFVFQQSYQKGLSLFMIKKSNLNAPEVYMVNLILACKYNQFQYFNYIVGHGLKRFVITENEDEIIQTIFRNFDEHRQSLQMLLKIMYYSNFNQTNRKVFQLPPKVSIMEAQRICDGLTAVMLDERLDKLFDFKASIQEESIEPLLHFAMTYRKPQLVKIILQRHRKPFVLNLAGKSAKHIRGSVFSRKLIWKYEKLFIKQHFDNQQIQQTRKKEKQRQKWLSMVYSPPKNSNYFSSPSKNNRTQSQSLMGSEIKSVEKSIHQRKAILKLRANRNKQVQIQQFDPLQCIDDKDETGIIFDFALNSQKNLNYFTSNQLAKKMNKDINSLSIYETFQRSALNTIERDFTKQFNPKQGRPSFILSPFRACQDVDISQNEKQQYIISRKQQKKQYICFRPCNLLTMADT